MSKKQLELTSKKMEMLKKKYPDIQFNLGQGNQNLCLIIKNYEYKK